MSNTSLFSTIIDHGTVILIGNRIGCLGLRFLQVLDRQFELLDDELAAFRRLPEGRVPRLGQEQLQTADELPSELPGDLASAHAMTLAQREMLVAAQSEAKVRALEIERWKIIERVRENAAGGNRVCQCRGH